MSLTDLSTIQSLLAAHGLRPNRQLGQNFLIESSVLDHMMASADIGPDDLVLEVGPGIGCLTEVLSSRAKAVFACEKDPGMTGILAVTVKSLNNVRVFRGDVLGTEFRTAFMEWLHKQGKSSAKGESASLGQFKIVSNLPYQITSFFLRTFLSGDLRPSSMTLLIQKEVAERIVAGPGDHSLLSLSVQFYGSPSIIVEVPKTCFYPVPKVDSAVIHIDLGAGYGHDHPDVEPKKMFRLMKCGFSSKRKTLYNNLSSGLGIDKEVLKNKLDRANLSQFRRAQELSWEEWGILYQALAS
ncbi:MAG: 16S rRNA (adenine1518-N6/adenine1519-N6)-dimethyltransferase [Parcubacteria group bacterium Gr01-1014_18]|nr:MAG: 16S rRNA (adenine1518-N6/adenine1519-N6)-dimethyltransferase [Parcubacteria group bacterium Greene0416_36]TSC81019.1 MAG: 16S rRNA (adenine1518-N6/adenine1519-N6)-dimethyltransferase [Parcubacteria group bacterium Gr01-1014_18]TSC98941.1 MAG: 16S rRNA (adenine1518-N6/adenine1519-N6)-dimethyltransferase [Parcubacteria group bacterium Greene1014_20]TSD06767.1 MAG: 16S rRNA (adenine1518-N6/adenine1519-N6)-dimethyltransferase [Parcubacteria group bacterium Greene0714_2]